MKTIGERLEKLRKALGLTQLQLARELGVTQQHISQVENGTRSPSDQFLKHICAYCSTTMLWLVKGEGEMFLSPEEIIKKQIDHIGEQAFFNAVYEIGRINIDIKNDTGINLDDLIPAINIVSKNPDLEQMISLLVKLYAKDDADLKAWIRIQFARAFPPDIEKEIEKKQTETMAVPTLIHQFINKDDL